MPIIPKSVIEGFKENPFVSALGRLFRDPEGYRVTRDNSSMTGFSGLSPEESEFMKYVQKLYSIDPARTAKYVDFESFDEDNPHASRALDVFASLITQGEVEEDETTTFRVVTNNKQQEKIFEEFEKRTNLKGKIFSKVRTACKYGISPQEIVFSPYIGISRINPIHPKTFKIQDENRSIQDQEYPYVQLDESGKIYAKFKDFQILPLSVDSDEHRYYGRSILDPVRKTLKIIDVLETTLAFREINRAAQKWLWLVDCTGLDQESAASYCRKMMSTYAGKVKVVDSNGQLNLSRSPLNDMGDVALPTYKDGAQVDIRALTKDQSSASLTVVQHFMSKFFGGIGIPSYYFSYEGAKQVRNASALTYNDVLLARIVYRYQSRIIADLWDMYKHESEFHGIEDEDFKIVLPLISTVDDLRRYQIMNLKIQVATALRTQLKLVDDEWIYNFLKFANKDVTKFKKFRNLVGAEEKKMMELAAQGVFIQPITTSGNSEDSPYHIDLPELQSASQLAQAETQSYISQTYQQVPSPDSVPTQGESIIPGKSIFSKLNRNGNVSIEERQLIQARLNSERTFQALLQSVRVKSILDDISVLGKMRLEHDEKVSRIN